MHGAPWQPSQPNRPWIHSDAEAPGGSEAAPPKRQTGSELQFPSTQGSAGEAVRAQGLGGDPDPRLPPALPPCPEKPFLRSSPPLLATHTLPVRPSAPTSLTPCPWLQVAGGHRAGVCEGHKTHLRLPQQALGEAPRRFECSSRENMRFSRDVPTQAAREEEKKKKRERPPECPAHLLRLRRRPRRRRAVGVA